MSGLSRASGAVLPRFAPAVVRLREEVRVLFGARLVWFLLADGALLLYGLFQALVSSNGSDQLYRLHVSLVVLPFLLLALPPLSALVAVERLAGSLDLALSARSTEWFFVRRALSVCAFFSLQGVAVIALVRDAPWHARLGSMAFAVALGGLFGAIVLFWAVRVRSSGGVYVASLATALALSNWLFAQPFPRPVAGTGYAELFFGVPVTFLQWLGDLAVLATVAVVLYLYARVRLRRPETML